MKKKRVVFLSAIIFAFMFFGNPIQSQAWCADWGEMAGNTYCATPVCHTGNRTSYTEIKYERYCTYSPFDVRTEYRMEKVNNGCCPYN